MTWTAINEDVPDDEQIVIVHVEVQNDPVWIGYKQGQKWYTAEGFRVFPTHWCELPEPPVLASAK